MKKFYIAVFSIIFTFSFISFSEATCGSSNCSLVRGSQSGITNEDRFVVDLSYRHIPQDRKKRGSDTISGDVLTPKVEFENDEIELDHHREFKTINKLAQLDVSYGVTNRFTVSLNVPFFNDRHHEHDDGVTAANPSGEFTNQDGTTGFGDISLIGKYAVIHTTKHLLIAGAGVKFKTGEYRIQDSEGTINEPTIMPGTGSTDAIISGLYNYSAIPNRLSFFAGFSHRFTTENSLDYEFGDTTFIDGGTNYRWSDKVNLVLQVNSRISARDEFINQDVPATGLTFINITPGVVLTVSENASLYSHVQVPVYQRVNEANLVPNYGLLIGVSYGF